MSHGRSWLILLILVVVAGVAVLATQPPNDEPAGSPSDVTKPPPVAAPRATPSNEPGDRKRSSATTEPTTPRRDTRTTSQPVNADVESLAYAVIGDPGPSVFHMWLVHEPERPPRAAEDVTEPAQDALTVRIELRDPREVEVRAALYLTREGSEERRKLGGSRRAFPQPPKGGLKELEFAAFFEPGATLAPGEVYEAVCRTFDAERNLVREVTLRYEAP